MAALGTAGACGARTGACGIAERAVPVMSIVLLTAGGEKGNAVKVNKVLANSRNQKIGGEGKG